MSGKLYKIYTTLSKKKKLVFTLVFLFLFLFQFTPIFAQMSAYPTIPLPSNIDNPPAASSTGSSGFWSSMAGYLKNSGLSVAFALIGMVCWILAMVGFYIENVCFEWLSYVLSGEFLPKLSYTNPASNDVIAAGLKVTLSLVNMVLVVILVWIAVATILRMSGYETRRILVQFLIIALLVNFAPVLCGLIVDASNITMNFFLRTNSTSSTASGGQKSIVVNLGTSLKGVSDEAFSKMLDTFMSGSGFGKDASSDSARNTLVSSATTLIVVAVTLFGAALIYTVFLFVFIARYFAIWILVILSPIAFACFVLPRTQDMSKKWLNQFVSWSLVGITCAFFLYLAGVFASVVTIPANALGDKTLASAILPVLVPLAFLFIGLIYGLETSAIGGNMIIGLGKKYAKAQVTSTAWVGKKAFKGFTAGSADRKIIPRIPPKDENGKRNWRSLDSYRTSIRGVAGATSKAWENTPFLRWYRPEPLKKFTEYKGAMDAAQKSVTGPSSEEMARVAGGLVEGPLAAAIVREVVSDRGDSQDLVKTYIKKWKNSIERFKSTNPEKAKGLSDEQILFQLNDFLQDKTLIKAFDFISNTGKLGSLQRIDPRLAKIGASPEEGKERMKKIMIDTKPSDVSKWEREVAEDKEVMEMALAVFNEDALRTMGNLKGKTMARQNTINEAFSDWVRANKEKPEVKGIATSDPQLWNNYLKHIEQKYKVEEAGYKRALSNPRLKSAGWGVGHYIPTKEEAKTAPISPGAAATGGAPPTQTSAKNRPGGKPFGSP